MSLLAGLLLGYADAKSRTSITPRLAQQLHLLEEKNTRTPTHFIEMMRMEQHRIMDSSDFRRDALGEQIYVRLSPSPTFEPLKRENRSRDGTRQGPDRTSRGGTRPGHGRSLGNFPYKFPSDFWGPGSRGPGPPDLPRSAPNHPRTRYSSPGQSGDGPDGPDGPPP